jgi:hypothetical protein
MSKSHSTQPPVLSTEFPNKGRASNGHFRPGNRFGRGNPFDRKMSEYRALVRAAGAAEERRACVATIVSAAESGDVAAAKVFLEVLFDIPRRIKPREARLFRASLVRLRQDAVPTGSNDGSGDGITEVTMSNGPDDASARPL